MTMIDGWDARLRARQQERANYKRDWLHTLGLLRQARLQHKHLVQQRHRERLGWCALLGAALLSIVLAWRRTP